MILFFSIIFPHLAIILAKPPTEIPPTLEAFNFNRTHVLVDYSKAFNIASFSAIKSAELWNGLALYSKASREVSTKIKNKRKTLYQTLRENRKILAKLNICKPIKDFYVRVTTLNKKKGENSLKINHDPLKIIAEEYKNKSCYQRSNMSIIWKENKSVIFQICQPKEIKISPKKGQNSTELAIKVTLDRKYEIISLKNCKKNIKKDKNETFFVFFIILLNLIIIASLGAIVLYWKYKKTY